MKSNNKFFEKFILDAIKKGMSQKQVMYICVFGHLIAKGTDWRKVKKALKKRWHKSVIRRVSNSGAELLTEINEYADKLEKLYEKSDGIPPGDDNG